MNVIFNTRGQPHTIKAVMLKRLENIPNPSGDGEVSQKVIGTIIKIF